MNRLDRIAHRLHILTLLGLLALALALSIAGGLWLRNSR
jgi:hypothetical protein